MQSIVLLKYSKSQRAVLGVSKRNNSQLNNVYYLTWEYIKIIGKEYSAIFKLNVFVHLERKKNKYDK